MMRRWNEREREREKYIYISMHVISDRNFSFRLSMTFVNVSRYKLFICYDILKSSLFDFSFVLESFSLFTFLSCHTCGECKVQREEINAHPDRHNSTTLLITRTTRCKYIGYLFVFFTHYFASFRSESNLFFPDDLQLVGFFWIGKLHSHTTMKKKKNIRALFVIVHCLIVNEQKKSNHFLWYN